MDTCIGRWIQADPATVFHLAAAVEQWPHLLPHYRWVRVLANHANGRRTVMMAARRDVLPGLAIPLRWTAIQSIDEHQQRIEFEHIGGISRGMQVEWTLEASGAGVVARIRHVFEPHWPVPDAVVRAIVGDYFVNGVARRTLRRIADLAEGRVAFPAYLANET